MIKSGKGGGNTCTGLVFEAQTDLSTFLSLQPHYSVVGHDVLYDGKKVAEVYKKHSFYSLFLKKLAIDWTKLISKRLLPDDSIFVLSNNTLCIIECKHQGVAGSVDEKLQTCDFKKKQYKKLMAAANIDVEYIYLLDNWFKQEQYSDVLNYIHSVDCDYYFEYIPLTRLGLPVPPELIND